MGGAASSLTGKRGRNPRNREGGSPDFLKGDRPGGCLLIGRARRPGGWVQGSGSGLGSEEARPPCSLGASGQGVLCAQHIPFWQLWGPAARGLRGPARLWVPTQPGQHPRGHRDAVGVPGQGWEAAAAARRHGHQSVPQSALSPFPEAPHFPQDALGRDSPPRPPPQAEQLPPAGIGEVTGTGQAG